MAKSFEELWAWLNDGQRQAIIRKVARAQTGDESICEEVIQAVLAGDLNIVLVDATIKLVDSNGHYIPLKGMKSGNDFVASNRNYHLIQPEIITDRILSRLQQYFTGLTFVSAEEFQHRVGRLLEQLQTIKPMKNLTKGVYFPICLPKIEVGDYGETLERVFLDAVKRSYEDQFSGRKFHNYRAGTLAGQVGIVSESRHGKLIEKMKTGPVVGIYFPVPLQGFSIPADRSLIEASPEGFLLTGAIDTAVAMVAKPEVLARDVNTPVLDCAANTWQSSAHSLCFRARGAELKFADGRLDAGGDRSGGVLFVG